MAREKESGDPALVSHEDFVAGLRTGRMNVTVDRPFAYPFAAASDSAWEWSVTGCMQLVLTWPVIAIALIVLAFVLHNGWLLLGIPAAFIAPPGMSGYDSYRLTRPSDELLRILPSMRRRLWGNRLHQALDFVAIGIAVYGFATFGWKSPVFLIPFAYVVSWAECVIYHKLCERAFARVLLTRPEFYYEATNRNVISVENSASAK